MAYENPSGLCWCGCGQRTSPARQNLTAHGWIKGQPLRYVKGHGRREGRKSNDYTETQGIRTHVHVAQQALGHKLPRGAQVHHVDGYKSNNTPSNLVICQDGAYHGLLHARARIVRAGGNPNMERVCSTCHAVKPLAAFSADRRKQLGTNSQCRACASRELRERYARRRAARHSVPSLQANG